VGTAQPNAPMSLRNQRWFVVWLGTAKSPIDPAAAKVAGRIDPALQSAASAGAGPQRPGGPRLPRRRCPVAGFRSACPYPVETPVPGMHRPVDRQLTIVANSAREIVTRGRYTSVMTARQSRRPVTPRRP